MSSCKNKQSIIFSCNSTKRVPKKAHKKPKKKIFPEKLNFSKCEATVTQQKSYPPQPLPHLQALPQPQLPPQQDIFRWEKKQTHKQQKKKITTKKNESQQSHPFKWISTHRGHNSCKRTKPNRENDMLTFIMSYLCICYHVSCVFESFKRQASGHAMSPATWINKWKGNSIR